MKTYDWSEVVEYLDNNLDKEFDFGNCCSVETLAGRDCNCLMASFFDSKGVDFYAVSYYGFEALDGDVVGLVKNSPINSIREIHMSKDEKSLSSGRDIKKRLDEITNQN